MSEWIVIGILDGFFWAWDCEQYENAQEIARVTTEQGESPWAALARQAEGDDYIRDLLSYRSKLRAENIIAYELTGKRLELEEDCLRKMLRRRPRKANPPHV